MWRCRTWQYRSSFICSVTLSPHGNRLLASYSSSDSITICQCCFPSFVLWLCHLMELAFLHNLSCDNITTWSICFLFHLSSNTVTTCYYCSSIAFSCDDITTYQYCFFIIFLVTMFPHDNILPDLSITWWSHHMITFFLSLSSCNSVSTWKYYSYFMSYDNATWRFYPCFIWHMVLTPHGNNYPVYICHVTRTLHDAVDPLYHYMSVFFTSPLSSNNVTTW